jgi:hypothetical protein
MDQQLIFFGINIRNTCMVPFKMQIGRGYRTKEILQGPLEEISDGLRKGFSNGERLPTVPGGALHFCRINRHLSYLYIFRKRSCTGTIAAANAPPSNLRRLILFRFACRFSFGCSIVIILLHFPPLRSSTTNNFLAGITTLGRLCAFITVLFLNNFICT